MKKQEPLEELWSRPDTAADLFMFEQGAVMRTARAAFQRRVGISDTRLRVLGMLYFRGELSQAELQRRLDVDGAAVTRLVKQMEADGLLLRRADPADNRFTLVALKPEGKAKLREVAQAAQRFMAMSLEGVSEEDLSCMRRVMSQVRANLEKL